MLVAWYFSHALNHLTLMEKKRVGDTNKARLNPKSTYKHNRKLN